MAERRTTSERIAEVERRKAQLLALEKQLRQREKEENRKARTKRLIEIGAEVESVLGSTIEREDLPKLRSFLMDQEKRGRYFSRAMGKYSEEKAAEEKRTDETGSVGETVQYIPNWDMAP